MGEAVELGVWCNVVVMLTSDIAVEMEDGPVAVEADQGVIAEIAQGGIGFLSSYPSEREAGLEVFVPTSNRLLAMKAMALRAADASDHGDLIDIVLLMRLYQISSRAELVELTAAFYPEAKISGRLLLAMEGIWAVREEIV